MKPSTGSPSTKRIDPPAPAAADAPDGWLGRYFREHGLGLLAEPELPPRQGLLVLTAVLAVLTCLVWGLLSFLRPPAAGFNLPVAHAPSKLEECPEEAVVVPALLSVSPAPTDIPAATPAPELPQGDAPMPSTTRNMTVNLFLSSWFLALPMGKLYADEPQKSAGETADRLQKIERDLDELKKQVAGIKELSDKLDALKKAGDGMDTLTLQIQANRRDLESLKKQLEDRPEARRAFAAPNLGQIQLINAWMNDMTVVVDGLSYRLRPGEARAVSKAGGSFSYEVLGVQPPVVRSLAAGETFTIRIAPR